MDFNEFSTRISKIKNLPLPGRVAQFKMAPRARIEELAMLTAGSLQARSAGVMALFYPDPEGVPYLLLILRHTYKGVHSNQIGLPGGQFETGDRDLLHTALRETEEEVGVKPSRITVIRALSELYIPPSNFKVLPYLGLYPEPEPFVMQASEVAALLEVSLDDFMDDGRLVTVRRNTSYATDMEVPAYNFGEGLVWGATAMILSEIRELFKGVL